MQVIPITDVPAQSLSVVLAGQSCDLLIYQKSTGLYIDVSVNQVQVIGGVVCQNLNRIVRNTYLGFAGDLMFEDLQGTDDPVATEGLGTRFVLCYLEESDLWGVQ